MHLFLLGVHTSLPNLHLNRGQARTEERPAILGNKEELLVCNGVSDEPLATCDSWSMKNATGAWKRHSYPNKGRLLKTKKEKKA